MYQQQQDVENNPKYIKHLLMELLAQFVDTATWPIVHFAPTLVPENILQQPCSPSIKSFTTALGEHKCQSVLIERKKDLLITKIKCQEENAKG